MKSALLRVRGNSMAPTVQDGDYVVGRRPSRRRPLRIGDIVVLEHPYYGRMVKRVRSLDAAGGTVEVRGDNAASVAGIDIGPVPQAQILQRAWLCISPRGVRRLRHQ